MGERHWMSVAGYWLGLAVVAAVIVCFAMFLHPGTGAAGGCGGG
jgi:preprotein translocase subunit SecG